MKRFDAAGGELLVCPICFNAKELDEATADRQRPARRHRPALGVDRRRRHHVQLLTAPGRSLRAVAAGSSLASVPPGAMLGADVRSGNAMGR